MSDRKIKVTDKRLFTADGELKNEFRHLEDEAPSEAPVLEEPAMEEPEPPPLTGSAAEVGDPEPPSSEHRLGSPTFFDLVGVVAQPIALYLGDAKMPDGESMENIELARLYIDLLEILAQKSAGNLTPEEQGFLDDLLYQLRLRFVEKSK